MHLDFMGSANSGHYVSFVKLLNGQWCKCNDGSVTKTTEQTVLKQKAYLLFYERDVPRESGPIRTERQQLRMENLLNLDKKRTERIVARRKEMQAEMMGQRVNFSKQWVCKWCQKCKEYNTSLHGEDVWDPSAFG